MMKMISFAIKQTLRMQILSVYSRYLLMLCTVALLCCPAAWGQANKKDKMMMRIDSLNQLAYDYPVEIQRACDSLINLAQKGKRAKEKGMLLMVRGVAETSLGNDNKALETHMESYRLFDSIHFKRGIIYSLCNIGATHLNINNYKEARDYFNKAMVHSINK